MPPPDDRHEMEEDWRERVHAADRRYQVARTEAEAALQRCGCNSTSVEIEALRKAQAREAEALDEFMRVLRIFHDLVVARIPPGR